MNVVLVTDWLVTHRGGEKVLESLAELFPKAPIFTLFSQRGRISRRLQEHPIHCSALDRLPWARSNYRYFLPLFPWAIQKLSLPQCHLVVSVSHAVAKGVKVPPGAKHVCYCLTPMRYLWHRREEYFSQASWRSLALQVLSTRLKRFDLQNEQVDLFLAVSRYVRQQIQDIYSRKAEVVYPPVDTGFFSPDSAGQRRDYFLVVSALVPYKRIDLVVKAFNRNGKKLIVVGSGPLENTLRRESKPNIQFRGWVSDEQLRSLYRGAWALIVMAREDFGLAPLEANACGTPVIAFRGGGITEAMTAETAVLLERQACDLLEEAAARFSPDVFSAERLRANALRFSKSIFQERISEIVAKL
ncbi:MAG TPA: glycosyltransferase [Acidobacteriota bacterium]